MQILLAMQPHGSAAEQPKATMRLPAVRRRPALCEENESPSSQQDVRLSPCRGDSDVDLWAVKLAQVIAEVLSGDRPVGQLIRWTDVAVYAELDERVRLLGRTTTATRRGASARASVRSVHVSLIADDVAEIAAHVQHNGCSRAIAARLEIHRGRWICTALVVG